MVKARHDARKTHPQHPAGWVYASCTPARYRLPIRDHTTSNGSLLHASCRRPQQGQAEVQQLCNAQPGASRLTHTLGTGALACSSLRGRALMAGR